MRDATSPYSTERFSHFLTQARALGLENDARFKEILQFVKDQLLVESLNEHFSNEFANPSDQKIEDYYKENSRSSSRPICSG